jgi:hypothetical protein
VVARCRAASIRWLSPPKRRSMPSCMYPEVSSRSDGNDNKGPHSSPLAGAADSAADPSTQVAVERVTARSTSCGRLCAKARGRHGVRSDRGPGLRLEVARRGRLSPIRSGRTPPRHSHLFDGWAAVRPTHDHSGSRLETPGPRPPHPALITAGRTSSSAIAVRAAGQVPGRRCRRNSEPPKGQRPPCCLLVTRPGACSGSDRAGNCCRLAPTASSVLCRWRGGWPHSSCRNAPPGGDGR